MDTDFTLTAGKLELADLPPGTVITLMKRFNVVERLGEGGMGKVYRAFDPIMNRQVALKVMKVDVPESQQRRFRLEARLCGTFVHPNLVRVLEVGTTKEHGLFWFTMEFLEGRDIGAAMEGGRTVRLHVLCEIFRQVLDALRYIHLRKIVHRDIKPDNIFVTHDSHDPDFRLVKLIDFGVARDLTDDTPEDRRLILGDPRYLAPEQSIPNGKLDGRADLYALGMTFYEAITGHHPFEDVLDEHPRELIRAQRERTPAPPSTYLQAGTDRDQAEAIDSFFECCCAKDPEHRFADARAMQRAMMALGG
jgi:serine/threonine-protein kinase